jgi:hypothetical protein
LKAEGRYEKDKVENKMLGSRAGYGYDPSMMRGPLTSGQQYGGYSGSQYGQFTGGQQTFVGGQQTLGGQQATVSPYQSSYQQTYQQPITTYQQPGYLRTELQNIEQRISKDKQLL